MINFPDRKNTGRKFDEFRLNLCFFYTGTSDMNKFKVKKLQVISGLW